MNQNINMLSQVAQTQSTRPKAPTLKEAFIYWLKLGFISFGGLLGRLLSCITIWWKINDGFRKSVFYMP